MYKIVIDANVWIRFARYRNLFPLLDRLEAHNITPVANRYLLSEVFNALTGNNWMTEKLATVIVSFIGETCLLTTENVVYRLGPDPKDNYLVDLAVQLNCSLIISDDQALQSFAMQPG